MKATTIPATRVRYSKTSKISRFIRARFVYSDFDLNDYEIVGNLEGSNVNKSPKLTPEYFDCISIITKSSCTKKGGEYLHGIGTIGKKITVLIFKLK
jgi:hypothetical protein